MCARRVSVLIVTSDSAPDRADEVLQGVLERISLHTNVSFGASANALVYSAAPIRPESCAYLAGCCRLCCCRDPCRTGVPR